MANISKLSVSKATDCGQGNWVVTRDAFGPQLIAGNEAARGDCIVTATTTPSNNVAEWNQIAWSGGSAVSGAPNQRSVSRQTEGIQDVSASVGGNTSRVKVWVVWANVEIKTIGARPSRAVPWSRGAMFHGPDMCGAFKVKSFSMTENARGQIVAVATLLPAGVGAVVSRSGKNALLALQREVTAADFVDRKRFSGSKSFVAWAGDMSIPQMQTIDPATDDQLFDTDGPDLPAATVTAETYNNFRQWVTFAGEPCSLYGAWFFRSQWKNQKVIMLEVGSGAKPLPSSPLVK
jgi:hypothetical protein